MQIYSNILYCDPTPLTRDVASSKFQKYGENIGDKKLAVEQTLSISYDFQHNLFSKMQPVI